jgi:hypothetical protein
MVCDGTPRSVAVKFRLGVYNRAVLRLSVASDRDHGESLLSVTSPRSQRERMRQGRHDQRVGGRKLTPGTG